MRRNQFGSIRKLASGRFQVRITNAQGDRIAARSIDGKPLTFESEKIARTYLLHLQSDFMRGVDPYASNPRSSETLKVRLEKYLDPLSGARLTSKPLRSSTAANYRRLADGYLFRQIDDFCLAQMPITAITRADVRKWYSLIQSSCVSGKREVKSRSHPARQWARSMGIDTSMHGRIDRQLIRSWVDAGAPIIKIYKETDSGLVQLAQAYRLLRAIFNVAIDDGLIIENPCRIKGAGTPRHDERPTATPEQVAALASEVPARYSMAVILAAYSSIRSSELLGLQRKHINEIKSSIKIEHQLNNYASHQDLFVPPKTDAGIREVFIAKDLMAALIDHMDRFTDADPQSLIFTTSTGLPLFKGRKSWFITAKRRLDLDHLHFHDLRHTGQSLAMEMGASVKDLQRRAGQSSEAAARIYMHGNARRDREVAESLGDHVRTSIEMWRKHG